MADTGAYEVTRKTTITAPLDAVHRLVDNFHEWQKWSPWEGLDPAMTRTYSGPDSGAGAGYAWSGNRKAGSGRMTITTSVLEHVDIDLHFEKPFKADNQIVMTLMPTREGTVVTWTMHGHNTGVMKLMGKVMSMDRMVGKDFEKGLAQLKSVAESGS